MPAGLEEEWWLVGSLGWPVVAKKTPSNVSVQSYTNPSVQTVRSYELQSLASSCIAHALSLSASHDTAPYTTKMWFPVCSQACGSSGVLSYCVDPKIDL